MKYPYIACVDITYNCTLRCKHCYNFSGDNGITTKSEMKDSELINLSKSIAALYPNTLCFCGGEPLLRFDVLLKCIAAVREINKKIKINMVTNGELLTEDKAEKLIEAGISMIQVSLDGASAESHDWLRNREGAYVDAINALKILDNKRQDMKRYNVKTCVAFCPSKKNFLEVIDAIDLCESLNVNYFRIQPLMILGRAKHFLKDFILNDDEYRNLVAIVNERKNKNMHNRKTGIEWGDPIDHLVSDSKNKYPSLVINAYGDILISPYLPITVGNVLKYSVEKYVESGLLENIWNNSLVEYVSHQIVSPERMDVSEKVDLPELMQGFLELEYLDSDFQTETQKIYLNLKEGK